MPKVTIITRKAYGGAYDVMSSKHLGADFNFAWPTSEVAVMGPEGAVNIIYRRDIAGSPTPDERRKKLMEDYKARFANPYTAAERGYIDDVIVPHETRPRLIAALHTLRDQARAGAEAQARQHPAVNDSRRPTSLRTAPRPRRPRRSLRRDRALQLADARAPRRAPARERPDAWSRAARLEAVGDAGGGSRGDPSRWSSEPLDKYLKAARL